MLHAARGPHEEALVAQVGERESQPVGRQRGQRDAERADDVHAEARGPSGEEQELAAHAPVFAEVIDLRVACTALPHG